MANERRLTIRATPAASRNRVIAKDVSASEYTPDYRIYVTAAPDDGKANKAILKLLAKELGVPKSNLSIIIGKKTRDKTILLSSA
ncbi:MAG: DUF167 domain-containing protein [Rhizobiaceae bacterium]